MFSSIIRALTKRRQEALLGHRVSKFAANWRDVISIPARNQKGIDLLTAELEAADISNWAMLLYLKLGQLQKAMQVAESGTRNRPEYHVGWYFAGCVFAHAGRPDMARRTWLSGVRNAEERLARSEHYGRRVFLGIMYAKLGMREKALEVAQRALALTPIANGLYSLFARSEPSWKTGGKRSNI